LPWVVFLFSVETKLENSKTTIFIDGFGTAIAESAKPPQKRSHSRENFQMTSSMEAFFRGHSSRPYRISSAPAGLIGS
jgi:hypothetical protein